MPISSNFQANPSCSTENTSKSSTEAIGNPKLVVSSMRSIRNVKNDSLEGLKTGNRTLDVSGLKILRFYANITLYVLWCLSLKKFCYTSFLLLHLSQHRTIGTNKEVPNSKVMKQNNSSRNLEQNMKLLEDMRSCTAHPIGGTEKQKPPTPSLKRKKIEVSNFILLLLLTRFVWMTQ